MPVLSCVHVSILKIISLCAVGVAFILQVVGFSTQKWDSINASAFLHHFNAYQNLWTVYDSDHSRGNYAFFQRVDDSIPEWKLQIIYLETTGFGMAFLSCLLVVLSSFVNKIAQRTKVRYTVSIMAVIGLFIGGSGCIAGVKLYQNQYRGILSTIALMVLERKPGLYGLTWAPYMCIAAGTMYIIVGVVLIIDVVITAAKRKTEVLPIKE